MGKKVAAIMMVSCSDPDLEISEDSCDARETMHAYNLAPLRFRDWACCKNLRTEKGEHALLDSFLRIRWLSNACSDTGHM